ncbi:sugar porter (SP) family MFS transporter [Rhizoctonia solani 123E]|uniref:Quinate transporter n=1 Tax=Rhizoctonia solani 123E TaxID=1423351 RepID=A0A074RLQ2_9AGAM|nr:sugar porter (SP) family MFS transporter [Rhizoctonia solani 123E]
MAFKRVEDRPSPKEIYNGRLYLLVLIAGWGGALFGYDSAVVGGLVDLPVFRTQFGLDDMTPKQLEFVGSNIESTYQAGCFFGSLIAFVIVERFGRRLALQWASGWFCTGAALMLGARSSIGLLYAGCALSGFGVGTISLASPLYMAEISPPKVRGQLVGLYEILLQVGECVGFWVNFGVSKHISISAKQWHIPIAIQFIPGGVLFISSMFLQETPRWLYKVGKREEAVTTLAWIRNLPTDNVYVQEEYALIGVQLDRELLVQRRKGLIGQLREISKPGLRNRLALGMTIMMCQNLTGAGAISGFAPTIFESIGMARVNSALFATGIYGLVKMVATFIALFWIVDRAGRRNPLMAGAFIGGLALYYVAAYAALAKPIPGIGSTPAGRFAAACLYIFAVATCGSWNGISWIICAEIFPLSVRALCQAITTATHWIFAFAMARATPYMLANTGYGFYLFFGTCMMLMIPFIYFLLPETKGISLEHVDKLFGYVAIVVLDVGLEDEILGKSSLEKHDVEKALD